MAKKIINKPGDRYFDWTLIKKVGKTKYRTELWLCECKCGARAEKEPNKLRRGRPQRCRACAARGRRRPDETVKAGISGGKNKLVKARCPRCGVMHHMRIYWTGKGVPRLYCERCKLIMERQRMPVQPVPSVMAGAGARRAAA